MPLEIRELVIKVTIAADGAKNTSSPPDDKMLRHWKEGIIRECIESVLHKMKTEAER